MAKTITVKIPFKGISEGKAEITIETEGYNGAGCVSDVAALTQAIGAIKSGPEEFTPEYYNPNQEHVSQSCTY